MRTSTTSGASHSSNDATLPIAICKSSFANTTKKIATCKKINKCQRFWQICIWTIKHLRNRDIRRVSASAKSREGFKLFSMRDKKHTYYCWKKNQFSKKQENRIRTKGNRPMVRVSVLGGNEPARQRWRSDQLRRPMAVEQTQTRDALQ